MTAATPGRFRRRGTMEWRAPVAQWIERSRPKAGVGGSNPSGGATATATRIEPSLVIACLMPRGDTADVRSVSVVRAALMCVLLAGCQPAGSVQSAAVSLDPHVENGTTKAIGVLVDGAPVVLVAAGQSATILESNLPAGAWAVEARLPGGSSNTAERLADDVMAVLDAHGVDRCVLAGESQGAGVVVEVAARYPERVSGLVLVDGLLPDGPRTLSDPFAVALRDDYERTIDDFVEACLPDPRHDALRHWGRLILDRSTSEHAIALYMAGAADPRPWLPSIRAPTLVIHCDGDQIAPLEDGRALAAGIATSTLRILAGDEHVPTMTRPTEIAALIEESLAGHSR